MLVVVVVNSEVVFSGYKAVIVVCAVSTRVLSVLMVVWCMSSYIRLPSLWRHREEVHIGKPEPQ
jgi:hypothetical protein